MSEQRNESEWLSFVRKGGYQFKGKLNSDLKIICGKETVACLISSRDDAKKTVTYDLVRSGNGSPAYRFIRTETALSGVDPENDQEKFVWQRLSSSFSELLTGSKWQCGQLLLSQNIVRSLMMWVPRISWFIPTKYTITDNGQCCGIVAGSACSLSNGKSVTVGDPEKAWEIMAAAIILSEDEIG